MASDPSGWVRAHADWGVEVAKQEASVRRYYARTLEESDGKAVLSRLQVLQPALTPAARWWHRELETESKEFENAPRATRAAAAFFWYHAENNCKRTPNLFGRKLSEYLRGERVHDLRSPKPLLTDLCLT